MVAIGWWHAAVLLIAGIGGGLAGSIAGLASVSTYPALLFVGLPPVAANVTNTVALVFNGVGSIWGSGPELRGQAAALRRTIPFAVVGGAAGGALLLAIPAEGFENVVPVLIGVSAMVIALPSRRTGDPEADRSTTRTALEGCAVLAICVYGGFFGAAAGVLLLALFLSTTSPSLAHANARKNVVLGVANGVAALVFIVFAPINWLAVLPVGIGCLVGSRIGPAIVRRAPATPLRLVIAVAGLALAVRLGVDAYR